MKLLAIADSHGKADLDAILAAAEGVDLVVHLGDGFRDGQTLQAALRAPMVQVAGNADAPLALIPEKMLDWAGLQIFLTHGHAFHVKQGLERLVEHATDLGADVVLFGHLHRRLLQVEGAVTLFNPASAWKNHDGTSPCVGLLEVQGGRPAFSWVDLANASAEPKAP